MATFAETDAQAQLYISALAVMVSKMDQNELDVTNSVPMTTAPYKLKAELTLIRMNIGRFFGANFPGLSKDQLAAKPTLIDGEYNLHGVYLPRGEGQTLTGLRWLLQDALESTEQRFNDHLASLSPMYYQNIPNAIIV
jgi:hypothetical protein